MSTPDPDPRPAPTPEDELLAMAGEAARALMTDGIGVAQRLARVHRLTGPVGRMTQGEVRDRIAEALRPWLRAYGDRRAAEAAEELVAAAKRFVGEHLPCDDREHGWCRTHDNPRKVYDPCPTGRAWNEFAALIAKYEART